MSEDRLIEIRDLLSQLVQQSRDAARRQEDMQSMYRVAMAAQRRWQVFGLIIVLPLLGLLLYLVSLLAD